MKIDKSKIYYITFTHYLDKDDIVSQTLPGKGYFRFRNFMLDLGYEVNKIEEVQ